MKKSAYQKLKEQNEGLKRDIYKLVMKPDEMETQALRMAYNLKFSLAEMVHMGLAEHLDSYDKGTILHPTGITYLVNNVEQTMTKHCDKTMEECPFDCKDKCLKYKA